MLRRLRNTIRGTSLEPIARKIGQRCFMNNVKPSYSKRPMNKEATEDAIIDHTKSFDYDRLIAEEKKHYSQIEITEQLTEGGKHANSAWEYYWQQVSEEISRRAGRYGNLVKYIEDFVPSKRKIRILSLGSGYCGHELMIAEQFTRDYEIKCVDINEDLFHQARQQAEMKGLNVTFEVADLNFIQILPQRYDMIFAHAVLHHIINLEQLFIQIAQGLDCAGVFHLVEVTGENRRLLWPENQEFVNGLLDLFPQEMVGQHRIQVFAEDEGMEGVRQEEILPLLKKRFFVLFEHLHGAFMRYVCLDQHLAPLFDPTKPQAKKYLDFLIDCDQSCVRHGLLHPLEIWGIYRPLKNSCQSLDINPESVHYTFQKSNVQSTLQDLFQKAPYLWESELSSWTTVHEHQREPLERLFQFTDVRGKTVLEVGAVDPALLFQLQKEGIDSGVGINNWYWDGSKEQAVKVAENIVLSYGDIRSLPLVDESFDLVFTVAAFEHIHNLPTALTEMYRLLKPGGLVYSYFGPLWSSGVGHHLYFEMHGVWYIFPNKESTSSMLQDYEHLILDREQMQSKLNTQWDTEDVNEIIYQIYDNPHINRYTYSDYIKIFEDSAFEVVNLQGLGHMEIKPDVLEQLHAKFGSDNDFSCATMEVLLMKE